jgi:hypothetical protein
MFIWHPGYQILILTHPGSRISDTFFCSHKFHKIENYFIFEMLKGKIWANFQRIIELFNQKVVTKLSKIWVWDSGSGKKHIRDPGSRGQKGTGSQVSDPRYGSATLLLISFSRDSRACTYGA